MPRRGPVRFPRATRSNLTRALRGEPLSCGNNAPRGPRALRTFVGPLTPRCPCPLLLPAGFGCHACCWGPCCRWPPRPKRPPLRRMQRLAWPSRPLKPRPSLLLPPPWPSPPPALRHQLSRPPALLPQQSLPALLLPSSLLLVALPLPSPPLALLPRPNLLPLSLLLLSPLPGRAARIRTTGPAKCSSTRAGTPRRCWSWNR